MGRKYRCFPRRLASSDDIESMELDGRELTRALRDAMNSENDAVKQYEMIADSTDDEFVAGVLQEIADEERVHVGELQALLSRLVDDEDELLDEGREEVEEHGLKVSRRGSRGAEPAMIIDSFNWTAYFVRNMRDCLDRADESVYEMMLEIDGCS
jgi:rubrerythrin